MGLLGEQRIVCRNKKNENDARERERDGEREKKRQINLTSLMAKTILYLMLCRCRRSVTGNVMCLHRHILQCSTARHTLYHAIRLQ